LEAKWARCLREKDSRQKLGYAELAITAIFKLMQVFATVSPLSTKDKPATLNGLRKAGTSQLEQIEDCTTRFKASAL